MREPRGDCLGVGQVNLPDLELAVRPLAHLVEILPASLLSMHRDLWRSGIYCALAWPQAGRKAELHCESAASRKAFAKDLANAAALHQSSQKIAQRNRRR